VEKSAIGQLVRRLRIERGWTIEELAAKFGKAESTVAHKETGRLTISPFERKLFARIFGMTIDEFDAGWRGSRVHEFAPPAGIPVINAAPAGGFVDHFADSFAQGEYADAPSYLARDADTMSDILFAVKVVGTSMHPTIRVGDHLVFAPLNVPSPVKPLTPGDVVFVRVGRDGKDHGVAVGRFQPIDHLSFKLTKDNPSCPPITILREHVEQLAVCVQRRTALI